MSSDPSDRKGYRRIAPSSVRVRALHPAAILAGGGWGALVGRHGGTKPGGRGMAPVFARRWRLPFHGGLAGCVGEPSFSTSSEGLYPPRGEGDMHQIAEARPAFTTGDLRRGFFRGQGTFAQTGARVGL